MPGALGPLVPSLIPMAADLNLEREKTATIKMDYGHKVPKLAKMQQKTSNWATHQLAKKMKLGVPETLQLVTEIRHGGSARAYRV